LDKLSKPLLFFDKIDFSSETLSIDFCNEFSIDFYKDSLPDTFTDFSCEPITDSLVDDISTTISYIFGLSVSLNEWPLSDIHCLYADHDFSVSLSVLEVIIAFITVHLYHRRQKLTLRTQHLVPGKLVISHSSSTPKLSQ